MIIDVDLKRSPTTSKPSFPETRLPKSQPSKPEIGGIICKEFPKAGLTGATVTNNWPRKLEVKAVNSVLPMFMSLTIPVIVPSILTFATENEVPLHQVKMYE